MNMRYIYLVASPQLIINFWDFWLNIVVCDLAGKCGDQTSKVLKLFTDLEHDDEELERSVSIYCWNSSSNESFIYPYIRQLNEFAWLCTHRKFRFQLCGLFSINHNMGFQMIITSFLYLVYLLQFDFMNL